MSLINNSAPLLAVLKENSVIFYRFINKFLREEYVFSSSLDVSLYACDWAIANSVLSVTTTDGSISIFSPISAAKRIPRCSTVDPTKSLIKLIKRNPRNDISQAVMYSDSNVIFIYDFISLISVYKGALPGNDKVVDLIWNSTPNEIVILALSGKIYTFSNDFKLQELAHNVDSKPEHVCSSYSESIIAISYQNSLIEIIDLRTRKSLGIFDEIQNQIVSIDFMINSGPQLLVVCCADGIINVINTESSHIVASISVTINIEKATLLTPSVIAVYGYETLIVIDISNGKELQRAEIGKILDMSCQKYPRNQVQQATSEKIEPEVHNVKEQELEIVVAEEAKEEPKPTPASDRSLLNKMSALQLNITKQQIDTEISLTNEIQRLENRIDTIENKLDYLIGMLQQRIDL